MSGAKNTTAEKIIRNTMMPTRSLVGVIRVERDTVHRYAIRSLVLLDLDAVRVVRADVVQRHDMQEHQRDQA